MSRISPASFGSMASDVRYVRSSSSIAAVVFGSVLANALAHEGSGSPPPDSAGGSRFQASSLDRRGTRAADPRAVGSWAVAFEKTNDPIVKPRATASQRRAARVRR